MTNSKLKLAYLAVAMSGITLAALPARAQDEEVNFDFGDDCEKLEELTYEALQLLLVSAEDRNEAQFCAVNLPYDCVDYSESVAGFGVLRPAVEEGYCKFVPELRRQEDRDFFIGQL